MFGFVRRGFSAGEDAEGGRAMGRGEGRGFEAGGSSGMHNGDPQQKGGWDGGSGPSFLPMVGRPQLMIVVIAASLLGTLVSCTACIYLLAAAHAQGAISGPCAASTESATVLQIADVSSPEASQPVGYEMPEMYGKVKETTIWQYWYHKDNCPSSKNCSLPPVVKLCTETVEQNKGTFDYHIIHFDEVERYVSRMELPVMFRHMQPAQQKDALMNALLARYGGVAMDITTILLRPLDRIWNEMIANRATFRGFMYRINGMQWGNSEVMAVWFLMSRREGLFSTAVRSQVIGMGDYRTPPGVENGPGLGYHNPYFALGDQTLTPIISMINYSFPKCYKDPTVKAPNGWKSMCPEHEFPKWNDTMPGPPRNDVKIMLREPRDGPQLPFCFIQGMGLWHVTSDKKVADSGIPPRCLTMKSCWEVFMQRYTGHDLDFIKLFSSGGRLKDMNRQQLMSDRNTFFYNWMALAGLPDANDR